MQYGALSYTEVSAWTTASSIFPTPSERKQKSPAVEQGLRFIASHDEDRVQSLFSKWKAMYNKSYPSNTEELYRVSNFAQHVAIAG